MPLRCKTNQGASKKNKAGIIPAFSLKKPPNKPMALDNKRAATARRYQKEISFMILGLDNVLVP